MTAEKDKLTPDQELLVFLQTVHAESEKLIGALSYNKKHTKQSYLIALYLSIVEFTGSLLSLISEKKYILTPAIMRSMLESYIDFENILRDEKYISQLEAENDKHKLKQLENAKAGNAFLNEIAKMKDIDNLIAELSKKIENVKTINLRERFKVADLDDTYVGLYKSLSEITHSSIAALYYRHFEINGDDFAIVYGKDLSADRLMPYLDTAVSLLIETSKKINSLYGDKDEDKFNGMIEDFRKIRAKY